jgi:hypothetical protein
MDFIDGVELFEFIMKQEHISAYEVTRMLFHILEVI